MGESAANAATPANPRDLLSPPGPDAADGSGAEVVRLAGFGRHAKATESGPDALPALAIRAAERRRWSAELAGSALAAMVVHGVGGIGKSVLAAQIAARLPDLDPGCVTASLTGEVTPDTFLAAVCTAVRRHPLAADRGGTVASAVAAVDRAVLPWPQRMSLLREHVLGRVPLLLVLDGFDDNLSLDAGTCTIRDPELVEVLKFWAGRPHRGRLLITSRHRFAVPEVAGRRIGFRPLGPLSQAGAIDLATSLPALGRLGEQDLDLVWRLLGGHPRAMEYLDGLLADGQVRFADLAGRLSALLPPVPGAPAPAAPVAPTELPLPVAEAATLAVSGALLAELFDRLSPASQGLLARASAYREPIGRDVLLLPVGQYSPAELTSLLDECRVTGLLTADPGAEPPSVSVHPWTATEVQQLLLARDRGAELADAHHRAAEYWRWRLTSWPQDQHAQREARYHLLQVNELEQPPSADGRHRAARDVPMRRLRRRLRPYAVASVAVAVTAFLTAEFSGALSTDRLTSSVVTTTPGTTTGSAAAVARARAASWVTSQVSRADIVACDPAMCTVLQAHGLPSGDLLVLRPGSADPLGSDVVVATPAVRNQFGPRLAGVYAPQVLASFGAGAQQIEVRAVAPDGAAAFGSALAADLADRRTAGRQLVHNPRLTIAGPARAALQAGRVDSRLLVVLAALTADQRLTIISFGSSGPGAGANTPLRSVQVTADHATATAMLAFVQAQRLPYRPARAAITHAFITHAAVTHPGATQAGGASAHAVSVLTVEFAAPSPDGLLDTQTVP
ncbi:MAG TPA: ATP-binding protein [Streptosporangiaceae bacterium]